MTAYRNDYFVIEPCRNCPIAGYLIVSPIIPAFSLSELRREALDSLGPTLAAAMRAIEKVIRPERIYCALFAEETHSVHFHLFPRTQWLLSLYADSESVDHVSGPQLFDWARRTFHSAAQTDYDQLTQAIFHELTPTHVTNCAAVGPHVCEMKLRKFPPRKRATGKDARGSYRIIR